MYLAIAINTDECVASQHLDEWAELLELQCLWPCLLAVVDGDLNTVWYRVIKIWQSETCTVNGVVSLTFGLYSSHAAWTTVAEGGSGSCFCAHTHVLMFCCCGWQTALRTCKTFCVIAMRCCCRVWHLHSPDVNDTVLVKSQKPCTVLTPFQLAHHTPALTHNSGSAGLENVSMKFTIVLYRVPACTHSIICTCSLLTCGRSKACLGRTQLWSSLSPCIHSKTS